jgi:hypothetical protein
MGAYLYIALPKLPSTETEHVLVATFLRSNFIPRAHCYLQCSPNKISGVYKTVICPNPCTEGPAIPHSPSEHGAISYVDAVCPYVVALPVSEAVARLCT